MGQQKASGLAIQGEKEGIDVPHLKEGARLSARKERFQSGTFRYVVKKPGDLKMFMGGLPFPSAPASVVNDQGGWEL